MTAKELRRLYIDYFKEKGHREIASASLLPENDPSVLFTTAGMHPLIPYLLGERHPLGGRLAGVQKCVRTCDIDEVGDLNHLTFFEMLGNWSLGDYFKSDAISMSYELLTERLHIPASRLAVTVFEGDERAPRDDEAYSIWKSKGLCDSQIYFYGREENWWGPAGISGPCGPDTEIFYDTGRPACSESCGPACHCGRFVEIWNNVFMEYNKNADGSYSPLTRKNVDTGMGLERVLAIMNGVDSVYKTELFLPLTQKITELAGALPSGPDERAVRIICEHARALTFILGDDRAIASSNTEQGYVVRRLIRRAIRHSKKLSCGNMLVPLALAVIENYSDVYSELERNRDFIIGELEKESASFERTLDAGLRRAEACLSKIGADGLLDREAAFKLYDTYGFPIEFTAELAAERGCSVDMEDFARRFEEHQRLSRQGAGQKFRGGMADNSERTTKLHTATHLLNGALRRVLGEGVYQRGSNITPERLRFDFSFDRKLTGDEISEVQDIVNSAIRENIKVECEEMTPGEAKARGAVGIFDNKYGETVKVYTIRGYSKEICGGPHASSTGELLGFKILKEESSSSGVRRIKAVIG